MTRHRDASLDEVPPATKIDGTDPRYMYHLEERDLKLLSDRGLIALAYAVLEQAIEDAKDLTHPMVALWARRWFLAEIPEKDRWRFKMYQGLTLEHVCAWLGVDPVKVRTYAKRSWNEIKHPFRIEAWHGIHPAVVARKKYKVTMRTVLKYLCRDFRYINRILAGHVLPSPRLYGRMRADAARVYENTGDHRAYMATLAMISELENERDLVEEEGVVRLFNKWLPEPRTEEAKLVEVI